MILEPASKSALCAYALDPEWFIRFHWPHARLYQKQIETLRSLVGNVDTYVHAGHKLGKDRVAAWAALWFFCTREPARVLILSATADQLHKTLFAEIDSLVGEARQAGRPLGVDCSHMLVRKPLGGGKYSPKSYIHGKAVSMGEAVSGHHLDSSEGPKVLFILSEASGIDDVVVDAAETQRHRMLVTGNPLSDSGFFAERCLAGDMAHPQGKGLLRRVIHIDGERDSPNVIAGRRWTAEGRTGEPPTIVPGVLSYQEYLERLQWPEWKQRTRLRGLFPQSERGRLLPTPWLDVSQQLSRLLFDWSAGWAKPRFPEIKHGPKTLGIDVGEGGDWTVWTVVSRWGVVAKKRLQTAVPGDVGGQTIRLMRRWSIDSDNVIFDAGGGGHAHAGYLRDRGYDGVVDLYFGEKSDSPREYANLRAELYGEIRKLIQPTPLLRAILKQDPSRWPKGFSWFCLPPDDALLRGDLACLPLGFDGEGRIRLPPKERRGEGTRKAGEQTVREMLGRSPDDGDSLGLAVWGLRRVLAARGFADRPAAY